MKYRIATNSERYHYPYSVEYLSDLGNWCWDSFQETTEAAEKRIELLIRSEGFEPIVIKEYGVAI